MRTPQPELDEQIKRFPPHIQTEIEILRIIHDEMEAHESAIRRLRKIAELVKTSDWEADVVREIAEDGSVTRRFVITKEPPQAAN